MVSKIIITSRILNLISGIAVFVINGISSITGFNDRRPSDLSDINNKLFPYPTAFSIWGLIYFLFAIFLIYQLLPRTYKLDYINYGISLIFPIQSILNLTWILTQSYFINDLTIIQLIIIYLLFLSLVGMYFLTFYYIKRDLKLNIQSDSHFYLNYWFGRIWLSFYTAWITGAICVDSFSVFVNTPNATYTAAAIVLAFLGIIALSLLILFKDAAFGFTLVWTSSWIAVNYKDALNDKVEMLPIFIASIIIACVVFIASVVATILNIRFLFTRKNNMKKV